MVQRIGNDRIVFAQERFEEAAIGIKARRIKDRIFKPQERGYARFQLFVFFLCAANEADRRHAITIAVERCLCAVCDFGIVGEAQIVVGTKIQDFGTRGNFNRAGLFGGDDPFALVQSNRFQAVKFGRDVGQKCVGHDNGLQIGNG